MIQKTYPGTLVCVEGIDGSGKTTLAKGLAHKLKDTNDVLLTKEPGGTPFGVRIRKIVQDPTIPLSRKAEYLLFAADRADHIDTHVRPALQKGSVVISDRMIDSSVAYQGYGRGTNIDVINYINKWTLGDVWPDITLFVDVPLEIALNRLVQRNNKQTRYEQEDISFMQRVADGFKQIYKKRRTNVYIIDGTQSIKDVLTEALTIVRNHVK